MDRVECRLCAVCTPSCALLRAGYRRKQDRDRQALTAGRRRLPQGAGELSALTIYQGLEAVLLPIPGLNAVILGEPTAVHDPPALYVAYQSFERPLRNIAPANNMFGMA